MKVPVRQPLRRPSGARGATSPLRGEDVCLLRGEEMRQ